MTNHIVEYLIDRYDLASPDDVRYIDDPDYGAGAIECYGRMPNSIEHGWFFVGYESELERELGIELELAVGGNRLHSCGMESVAHAAAM